MADFINRFEAERQTINRWVEGQTKEKITELIPQMDAAQGKLVRLILVNAIYLSAA